MTISLSLDPAAMPPSPPFPLARFALLLPAPVPAPSLPSTRLLDRDPIPSPPVPSISISPSSTSTSTSTSSSSSILIAPLRLAPLPAPLPLAWACVRRTPATVPAGAGVLEPEADGDEASGRTKDFRRGWAGREEVEVDAGGAGGGAATGFLGCA